MIGRHEACDRCGARLLVSSCSNPDCPSNFPTGPLPVTNADRAVAEIEHIKRGLRERLDRGEG